jgi:steroid delta-isomerase-like uncharacterized protein
MSPEEMKERARQGAEDCWNAPNMDELDEILAPDYKVYVAGTLTYDGRDHMKEQVSMARAAFPDVHVKVDDLIAEGDKDAARFTFGGTHTGPYVTEMGTLPPTGKKVEVTGIIIFRFADGKIVENREVLDPRGMLQQLGVVPSPGQRGEGTVAASA